MNISGAGAPNQVQSTAPTADKRVQLQMMLLKKTLDMQRSETEAILQQAEGKGQNVDIRC